MVDKRLKIVGTPGLGANRAPKDVYFYNSNAQVDSNRPQRFEANANGQWVLHMDRWEHAEASPRLEGILYCSNGWDEGKKHRSVRISAPLRAIKPVR